MQGNVIQFRAGLSHIQPGKITYLDNSQFFQTSLPVDGFSKYRIVVALNKVRIIHSWHSF